MGGSSAILMPGVHTLFRGGEAIVTTSVYGPFAMGTDPSP